MADPLWMQGKPVSSDAAATPAWMQGKPVEGAAAPAQGPANWQDRLEPFTLPNGSQTVKRPDGAVYIKEANDSRFKDQEGWKLFDPKTGLWAPTSDEDASAYGPIRGRIGGPALKSWTRNMLAGLQRPGEAVAGLAADAGNATGLLNDKVYLGFIKTLEDRERYRQAVKNTSGTGAGFTQTTGEMLPAAAMTAMAPQAAPTVFADSAAMAPTIAPFAQRAAANAVVGGASTYLTTPGTPTDRAKAGAAAAVAAPLMQGASEKVVFPALGKAYNWAAGKMKPGAAEIERLGQLFDVPTTVGDATGAPGTKKLEVALENVPLVGMGTFRQQQDAKAAAAAADKAKELMKEMTTQGWTNLDQVQKAAKAGRRGAQALLNEIDAAGSDWNRIMQTSGNLKVFQGKLAADSAYNKVEALSAKYGEVPLTNTTRALEEAKRELASSGLPDEATLGLVNKLSTNLNRQAAQGSEGAVAQAVGAPGGVAAALPSQSAVDTSFSGMRQLRSTLGNRIDDYYSGKNAVVGKEGAALLQRVKDAVEQDMETFAKTNGPELATAWRDADRVYKTQVVPYKDRALATALKSATPDEIFGQFMKVGRGDRAENFYNTLDPKGQAAVRYGLVQNALEQAINPGRGDQAAVFSPAKFAGYLEKMGDATGVAFKGQDKWEIDGLAKLMRHVERAGQFAENPPTGNRLAQMGTGVGLLELGRFSPVSAAGAWSVAKLSKVLLTSPAGKRLLLAASELPAGSKVMQDLVNNQLPKVLSRAATPDPIANAYQFDQPQD